MKRLSGIVLAYLLLAVHAGPPAVGQVDPNTTPPTPSAALGSAGSQPAPSTGASGDDDGVENDASFILGDNESRVRRIGATNLLKRGTPEAVARLVAILQDAGAVQARLAICEAVAAYESPPAALATPLITMLGSEPSEVNAAAALALRRFENGKVVETLQSIALDAAQPVDRRIAVTQALGGLGDEIAAVAALVTVALNADEAIQASARESLQEAAGTSLPDAQAITSWWERNKDVSPSAWLRRRNDQLRTRLRTVAAEHGALRGRLVDALRDRHLRTPEPERPALLLSFLQDPLSAVRRLGLELINLRITDRKEIVAEIKTQLGAMIHDPDAGVRRSTARTVGDLRLTAEIEKLMAIVETEPRSDVCTAQVKALRQLDDPRAIPTLIKKLGHSDETVVAEAARAIGRLARKGRADVDATSAGQALLARLASVPEKDDNLREHLISAMGQIGSEQVRPVLRVELGESRGPRTRQSAIRWLASYADPAAAADIRPFLSAPEPRIRREAAGGLALCGQGEEDLAALAARLDAATEPEQTVREQAWTSYLAIEGRLPVPAQLKAAASFNIAGNAAAQQRRLAILAAAESKFVQLPEDQRCEAYESLAQAREAAGEFRASAGLFEQSAKLAGAATTPRYGVLIGQSIAARLRAGDDAAAMDQVSTLLSAAPSHAEAIGRHLADEIGRRLTAHEMDKAESLLAACKPLEPRLGGAFGAQAGEFAARLDTARKAARKAEIDRLLQNIATVADAEKQLVALGPDVLPPLVAVLTATPTTTAPAGASQQRLISVAKQLLPDWSGYDPAGPAEARSAALADLAKRIAPPPKPDPKPAEPMDAAPESQPASQPSSQPSAQPNPG